MGKHCRCCTDKQRICSTCTVVGKKIPGPERPGITLNKPRVKKLMVGVSKCSVEGRINEAGVQLQITGYLHLRSNQRPAHQFLHLVCLMSNILLSFRSKENRCSSQDGVGIPFYSSIKELNHYCSIKVLLLCKKIYRRRWNCSVVITATGT